MHRALFLASSLALLGAAAFACGGSSQPTIGSSSSSGGSSGGSGSGSGGSSGGASDGGSGSSSGGSSGGSSGSSSGSSSGGSSGGSSGSSSGGSSGGAAFAGSWTCSDKGHLTFTQPPGAPPQDKTTNDTVQVTDNKDGTITGETVVDGGSACPLKYTVSGTKATAVAGQKCTAGTVELTYTSGDVTLTGTNTMTSNVAYDFSGTASVAGVPTNIAGSGTSQFTCTR